MGERRPGDAERADRLAQAERVGRMGSWVVEADGASTWSDNLLRIFGLPPGRTPTVEEYFGLLHPDDRDRIVRRTQAVFGTGGTGSFEGDEYRIVRPGGEVRWVRGAGTTERDAGGRVVRMVGAITDITEEVGNRDALLDAHRMLEEAERIAHVGSFQWDPATGGAEYSVEFLRILGLQPDAHDRVLRGWAEFLHPQDREAQARWFAEVLRAGTAAPLRVRIVRDDGREGLVEVRAVARADARGVVSRVFGSVHDVTERTALEQGLQDAARFEAVGNVAAGVAHDLNNYLTVLQGALDVLGAGRRDEAWRAGQRAMEQCISLTRNLLAYSRSQPVLAVDVDLAEVVHDAAVLLRRLVGSAIEVVVDVPPGGVFARADRGHVENVLVNLGINARDAMPDGGTLRLALDRPGVDDARAAGLSDGTAWARLAVEDTGVGIAPEDLPRIFDLFFTTKPAGGSGLGLPSARATVRHHGGDLRVHSAPGQGTRFEAWLPTALPPLEAHGPVPPLRTVLVVDDVPEVRELAVRFLHRGGWRTLEADDAEGALALLAGGGVDAVLSDVVMPGRSGFDLVRAMRAGGSAVPVVLMTGYAHPDEARGIDAPIVRKPFRQADLLASLEIVTRPRSNS